MSKILLTNTEYDILYTNGGDSLIAFFCMLRANKKGSVLHKKGKKGAYSTIRHYTGLSLNTIKKYFPILIKLGLCEVHDNGNIAVHSRKYNKRYRTSGHKEKLIPINVHNKFSSTKASCYFVRVNSNLNKQKKASEKKAERIELYRKRKKGRLTLKEHKSLRKLQKRGLDETTLKNSYRSHGTISNALFSRLKGFHENQKISGNYHKTKLIKMGVISQKRDFVLFQKGKFSKFDLNYLRNNFGINGLFLNDFGIFKETSPKITLLTK